MTFDIAHAGLTAAVIVLAIARLRKHRRRSLRVIVRWDDEGDQGPSKKGPTDDDAR